MKLRDLLKDLNYEILNEGPAGLDTDVADIVLVDGEPKISVGGKGEREGRVYTVEGKPDLSAEWGPTNNFSRFFRVKAELAE